MNEKDSVILSVQNEILMTLNVFHRFCISHGIHYSLHGGTLIGAIREKGFIEWDDDADISMTRENYTKYLDAYKSCGLGDNITFDEIRRKIIVRRPDSQSVWVDLFIYDYISSNRLLQKIKIITIGFFLAFIRTPEMLESTKVRGRYTGWRFMIIKLIMSAGKHVSEEKKYKLLETARQSFKGSKQLIHRSNDQFHGIKEILPKEDMSEYRIVPFENTELMISKNYDHILRRSFGDYLTPVKIVDDVNAHKAAREKM